MKNAASHGAGGGPEGHDVLQELEEEINSWLEQGGTNLMARLERLDPPEESSAKESIREFVRRQGTPDDGHTTAVPADGADVTAERAGNDAGARWGSLLAAYIDSLSHSARQGADDTAPYAVSYGLDEGHAGGCG
ncbi:DUF6269 family protein [Streptomyces alkaliterrae]|uniref:Uncharacterized protein n=1 Tax=Streptomyces alkaliterrae TaxID=2213162 RepID=A0A5P0YUH2_9ACTN|nr:DUF6269 family protein [Streptomyces alkaliterrae]MBB1254660.1 hypothetical protein [Streptomyces alkaliterrae]MBB1261114.1 hypothetical protein [Streptomyces alkaliterrae]MQS03550.1 hypothetical protein [Streptomyces alkaliterrae]